MDRPRLLERTNSLDAEPYCGIVRSGCSRYLGYYLCGYCGRYFPTFYVAGAGISAKTVGGFAEANFWRHVAACKRRNAAQTGSKVK